MTSRTTLADALHQTGQRVEAGVLFAEAERMQHESEPEHDLLYSLRGFQYCEWLLAPAEQAAWRRVLNQPVSVSNTQIPDVLTEIERRAQMAQVIADRNQWLLDIALYHLTVARVELIRAILANLLPQPTLDLPQVAAAVNGIRAAGQVDYLALGLLTAALYHFVRGEHNSAHEHLAEAELIAERGPMPLCLADIQLHRARMFHDQAELTRAAQNIRDLGYGRRTEEITDAEGAATAWTI
jgi:hypothetical protein